ncbi:GMC oxidoreductase, partial [Colletotrichum musicola]
STLLLEAGDDTRDDPLTKLATGLTTLPLHDANSWSFWVRHQSASDEGELRNNQLTWKFPNGSYWVSNGAGAPAEAKLMGVWCPRGVTVGGSSVVNAMATFLPNDSEWDYVANITGDASWRRISEMIEKNHYLPEGTPGHGFDGHFETNLGNGSQYLDNPGLIDVYKAMVGSIGQDPEKVIEMLSSDPNFLGEDRDTTEGLWGLPFHAKANWERYSSRDYIYATLDAKKEKGSCKYPLTLSTTSLATKILFDEAEGARPKAIGVEYLKGACVYGADERHNATTKGEVKQAFACREVIVAGGAFNWPQILQLSGIGNREELEALDIKVIADLPGVGRNLQDNQEYPVVGHAQLNLTAEPNPNAPVCAKGQPDDPCLELWEKGLGP